MTGTLKLDKIASQVRRDIIRMVTMANSGHPGGSLSSADIMTALFFNELKINPSDWKRSGKGEDMFFLSAGHMTPVLYSVLARRGYFPVDELNTFRKYGTRLQGHPSVKKELPGIYEASGSLGQGLSVACGAALAKKLENDPNYIFVLMGDGETEEGQVWEAAMFAASKKINNLIAITDWNGQQIDGTTEEVQGLGDLKAKWEAFGWKVIVANGNNIGDILDAFAQAKEIQKGEEVPVMLLMKTIMGKGVDFMEDTNEWHGKAPSQELADKALAQLKETLGDF